MRERVRANDLMCGEGAAVRDASAAATADDLFGRTQRVLAAGLKASFTPFFGWRSL